MWLFVEMGGIFCLDVWYLVFSIEYLVLVEVFVVVKGL